MGDRYNWMLRGRYLYYLGTCVGIERYKTGTTTTTTFNSRETKMNLLEMGLKFGVKSTVIETPQESVNDRLSSEVGVCFEVSVDRNGSNYLNNLEEEVES